jgi:hypothetical protein
MVGAFLVAAPVHDPGSPTFLNQFARLSSEYRSPPDRRAGWIVYLKHLRIALKWPAA